MIVGCNCRDNFLWVFVNVDSSSLVRGKVINKFDNSRRDKNDERTIRLSF